MNVLSEWYGRVRPHWSTVALVLTWIGVLLTWWRRRTSWRRKHFAEQVNFSLNYIVGDRLVMRTLLETAATQVWLNDYGVRLVKDACTRTTPDQPLIVLKDPQDMAFVNRAALNALSERFADVYLAASMGLPVETRRYVFGITYEKYDIMRTLKLRVLVIEEATLLSLFGPENGASRLKLDDPWLMARLTTLRLLYERYVKEKRPAGPVLDAARAAAVTPEQYAKTQKSDWPVLDTVELGVIARR